ncbi:MAG: outer membrane protein assembly factor BamD [Candidatus Omnitrophota bacterium]|nr:MAG: outer membrane protein assembly factor BamD [Candidatus Omnitrophota bacterium]
MKKSFFILCIILYCLNSCNEASAFWIWTPKSKKLVNPKYASKDTPEQQFEWAMHFFDKKEYKRAAEEFTRLVAHFKDSDLAPEAQYYAGRSYEEANKFYPAFDAYQKTIEVYPFTKRIDEIIERQYNLGNTLYRKYGGIFMGKEIMTDLERAIEIFRTVRKNAPFGEYADQAQFMIAQCYKKSEQYDEAKEAFQELIDEYPHSILADKAEYEAAQCTYLASLNPDYDQELTEDAIKEFKKIAKSKENSHASKEAEDALFLLEDKKAQSLFNIAKFYEKQKHYRSARIYYEEVLEEYSWSSFAKLARERLKDIAKLTEQEE